MRKLTVLPILFVLLASAAANAKGWGKGHGCWTWWEDEGIVSELKLSEDQTTQIKAVHEKFKPAMEKAWETYDAKKTAYQDAKANPETSNADVIKAFDVMWDAKYKMMRVKLDMMLETRAILTPEQVKKLHEIKKKHMEEMKKKYEKS